MDWSEDTTNDFTTLLIQTPQNFSYKESELPITITTMDNRPLPDGILFHKMHKRHSF
jgi:hypothetical protein